MALGMKIMSASFTRSSPLLRAMSTRFLSSADGTKPTPSPLVDSKHQSSPDLHAHHDSHGKEVHEPHDHGHGHGHHFGPDDNMGAYDPTLGTFGYNYSSDPRTKEFEKSNILIAKMKGQQPLGDRPFEGMYTFHGIRVEAVTQGDMDSFLGGSGNLVVLPYYDYPVEELKRLVAEGRFPDFCNRCNQFFKGMTSLHKFTSNQGGPIFVVLKKMKGRISGYYQPFKNSSVPPPSWEIAKHPLNDEELAAFKALDENRGRLTGIEFGDLSRLVVEPTTKNINSK